MNQKMDKGKEQSRLGMALQWLLYQDGIMKIVETIIVILIVLFVVYGIICFVFSSEEPNETRVAKILYLLNENWKVLLLILVPLFYRGIRTFIEEVVEFRGVRRQKSPKKQKGWPEKESE